MLDRFTKIALILMLVLTASFCIGSYIGYMSGSEMETAYVVVMEEAAVAANVEPKHIIHGITDVVGEPVGFTIAGIVAGFIIGYCWADMFRREEDV